MMVAMTTADICRNDAILDQWHPIAVENEVRPGVVAETTLLGCRVSYSAAGGGDPVAWRSVPAIRAGGSFDASLVNEPLPLLLQYGYVWSSLGQPPAQLFELPEYAEPDRRNIHAATIGVACSAPRAVENFLDMGHFPFVHAGILGIEPHTEVREYEVDVDDKNEIWATECVFYQPVAAMTSEGGQMSNYIFRVPHPYCVLLYKSCPLDPTRMDVIGLFVRSVTADHIEASMFLSVIDVESTDSEIKRFQQTIFAQDKPILENQHPKLLPLDPRFETPIRADHVAITYRRWLSELGVTYGVIPAA
jgi:phenylpropionate dioxygenase-like ring-hydroxylating dioxygenase large terminal subunit